MEETYQITSALKFLKWGREVAVVTDARFSGVSTGACIGHVGPEALAGGPIGKLRDGDLIRIVIDRNQLIGTRRSRRRTRRQPRRSRPRKARAMLAARAAAARPRARQGPARRHAAVGRPAARRRRHLGRLRLRRRADRRGAGGGRTGPSLTLVLIRWHWLHEFLVADPHGHVGLLFAGLFQHDQERPVEDQVPNWRRLADLNS